MIYDIYTDNIDNASKYFLDTLTKIFNSIHGSSFNKLNKLVMKPMIKNKKNVIQTLIITVALFSVLFY